MPEVFTLQNSENNSDPYQFPKTPNDDRYTSMPYENTSRQTPGVYAIGANDDNQPIQDEPAYSPVMNNSYPSSRAKPELYHLKGAGGDNNNVPRPPSSFSNTNRVSPMPHQNSSEQGPAMYHIRLGDGNRIQSPSTEDNYKQPKYNDNYEKPTDNDNRTDSDDPHQKKVTMYMLTTTGGENFSSSHDQRTPSPPIRPTKKQQQQPISYDIVDYNKNTNKQSPVPIVHQTMPKTIHHVPLSQSKASASIQRSMEKFRFGN